ncbi:hypothetical protein [Hyphomonas pacifica]|uniref:Uncharacterized protein n=1 Tax=Hyphomonas pacifica TaxID=1280941 RepID=A0A062U854_9PROT|nr:hypothetical protein [Hyphomonas pacifica]MAN45292.1 hypothetical protein [Hyphomonas sp.]MBR9808808.1 hypothetical protein [Alphaproteobacteria bacterium]KCZ52330.1 hypothetical protein HY2_08960 [Hyphomonas pacifica]RAN34776.1 hypothetical protein HY3_09765 [Hyphomonas pacifica]RAN36379.1 hypothetical protein HY11_01265 [Hyphomonas pacifica]
MRKGTLLTNNWLLGGVSLIILTMIAVGAATQGSMALEFGGLQMTFSPHEDGGVRLSIARSFGTSDFTAP